MEQEDKDKLLMPPPRTNSAMFPAPNSYQRVSSGLDTRRKTPLAPGHSPMDWAALTQSGADLRQGRIKLERFTEQQLLEHKSMEDMWMAINGKVFNVTPYVNFHPGGKYQLLRGAGKDATKLFQEIHPWVNVEMMLDKCFIGYLVKE
jgi:cytochrome b involved in lipid metabolism